MVSGKTSLNKLPTGRLLGKLGGLWTGLEAWIPFGYQNETGFHYGIEFISSLLDLSLDDQSDPLLP